MFRDNIKNLDILQEECAEVARECLNIVQIVSKIKRFGLNDTHAKKGKTNKGLLEEELGDLLCMIDILEENGIVDKDRISKAKESKRVKLKKWYNYYSKED